MTSTKVIPPASPAAFNCYKSPSSLTFAALTAIKIQHCHSPDAVPKTHTTCRTYVADSHSRADQRRRPKRYCTDKCDEASRRSIKGNTVEFIACRLLDKSHPQGQRNGIIPRPWTTERHNLVVPKGPHSIPVGLAAPPNTGHSRSIVEKR